MLKHSLFTIVCLHHAWCMALPAIPEAVKNAASVMFTTITKTTEGEKENHSEEHSVSPTYIFATFSAATITTTATNALFQSTRMYKLLDQAAKICARRYTRLPGWARRKIMPATSLIASTAFSTVCFMALLPPAKIVEDTVEESFNELKDAKEKRPEQ